MATIDYLCFTSLEDNCTIKFTTAGTPSPAPTFEFSVDGGNTWTTFTHTDTVGTETITTLPNKGNKIYFRGDNTSLSGNSNAAYSYFAVDKYFSASGNVMSLVDKTCTSTTIPYGYCFRGLFANCAKMLTPPRLPATTLTLGCYYMMFYNCTMLNIVPELPATTLTTNCYAWMFAASGVSTLPDLSRTTLMPNCYANMFNGCRNIKISEYEIANYSKPYKITASSVQTNAMQRFVFGAGGLFSSENFTANKTYYLLQNENNIFLGYLGDIPKKIKGIWIGSANKARKVKAAWIGVNNIARKFYSNETYTYTIDANNTATPTSWTGSGNSYMGDSKYGSWKLTSTNSYSTSYTVSNAFDGSSPSYRTAAKSNETDVSYVQLNCPNTSYVKLTKIVISSRYCGNSSHPCVFQGSITGATWTDLTTFYNTSTSTQTFEKDITNTNYFKYFRIVLYRYNSSYTIQYLHEVTLYSDTLKIE